VGAGKLKKTKQKTQHFRKKTKTIYKNFATTTKKKKNSLGNLSKKKKKKKKKK
jgi:hypothetical protein